MISRPSLTRLAIVAPAALVLAACSDQVVPPTSAPFTAPAARVSAPAIPTGKAVVVFNDTSSIPLAGVSLIQGLGGTISTSWDDIGVAWVTGLSAAALTTLQASDLVAGVGLDRVQGWLPRTTLGSAIAGDATLTQGDPFKARFYADGTQWNMRVIKADSAWANGFQGTPSTRVAILDTGIDYDHRELRGLVDLAASKSFSGLVTGVDTVEVNVPVEPQLPGDQPFMDNHFHGTHVASTVASNSISVAAVAPKITLIAVKVLNFQGSGTFESVANGIRYASRDARAQVINMSLGAEVDANEAGVPALLQMMSRVIKDAEKKGTIVISAAGNSGLNLDVGTTIATPCEQSTVCVSATGPLLQQNFDQPATYTNYGITAIDVAAPGGNATDNDSTYTTKDLIIGACSRRASVPGLAVCRANTDGVVYFYAYAAGTSMATPHVSGVAALIKSVNPTLSVKGLRQRLYGSSDDVGVPGRDVYSNHGRVNAWRGVMGN